MSNGVVEAALERMRVELAEACERLARGESPLMPSVRDYPAATYMSALAAELRRPIAAPPATGWVAEQLKNPAVRAAYEAEVRALRHEPRPVASPPAAPADEPPPMPEARKRPLLDALMAAEAHAERLAASLASRDTELGRLREQVERLTKLNDSHAESQAAWGARLLAANDRAEAAEAKVRKLEGEQ